MVGKFTKFIVVFMFLIVSGCVTYPDREEYETRLNANAVSVSSIDNFSYTPLSLGEVLLAELGDDDSIYDFGNGASFYKAFSLPEIDSSISIEVISLFNTYAQAVGHVPYLSILALNGNYEEVLRTESRMSPGKESSGSVHFSDTVELSENARFVILYVDPKNLNKLVSWYYGAHHMGAVGAMFSGDKGAKVGLGGPIKIEVKL